MVRTLSTKSSLWKTPGSCPFLAHLSTGIVFPALLLCPFPVHPHYLWGGRIHFSQHLISHLSVPLTSATEHQQKDERNLIPSNNFQKLPSMLNCFTESLHSASLLKLKFYIVTRAGTYISGRLWTGSCQILQSSHIRCSRVEKNLGNQQQTATIISTYVSLCVHVCVCARTSVLPVSSSYS